VIPYRKSCTPHFIYKEKEGIYKAKMDFEGFCAKKVILILEWQHAKSFDFRQMRCMVPCGLSTLSRLLEKFINQTLSF